MTAFNVKAPLTPREQEMLAALKHLVEHTESCRCAIVNGDICHHPEGKRFTSDVDAAMVEILHAIAIVEGREE